MSWCIDLICVIWIVHMKTWSSIYQEWNQQNKSWKKSAEVFCTTCTPAVPAFSRRWKSEHPANQWTQEHRRLDAELAPATLTLTVFNYAPTCQKKKNHPTLNTHDPYGEWFSPLGWKKSNHLLTVLIVLIVTHTKSPTVRNSHPGPGELFSFLIHHPSHYPYRS